MNGLKSLLRSRKFWIAVAGVCGVILTETFGWTEADAHTVTTAIVTIASVLIGSIALEDAATKRHGDMPEDGE